MSGTNLKSGKVAEELVSKPAEAKVLKISTNTKTVEEIDRKNSELNHLLRQFEKAKNTKQEITEAFSNPEDPARLSISNNVASFETLHIEFINYLKPHIFTFVNSKIEKIEKAILEFEI